MNPFIPNLCLEVTTRISILHNVSKEGRLFYFMLRWRCPALHCVVSVELCGASGCLHDCPEAQFLLCSNRCKHPFWDGRLVPLQICQLSWFEPSIGFCLQGVFSPASAPPRGRRSAKLKANVELTLSLYQRHGSLHMKICVVASEISTNLMVAVAFAGVQFRCD